MKRATGWTVAACVLVLAACAAENNRKSGQGGGAANGALAGSSGGGIGGGVAGTSSGTTGGASGTGTAGTDGIIGSDEPVIIDACPGAVPADAVTKLKDPAVQTVAPMRWLYPYELTVFPRGLEAPLLMWDEAGGATTEHVYIHIKSTLFDYQGCLPPTKSGQLQIPQDVWDQAGVQSRGGTDPLTVDVVSLAGGNASKLPTRKLQFALASLKNAIYYNTYGSALATGMAITGGVVMRVMPKQAQPDVFLKAQSATNCIGCHAVSADGSKLVAEEHVQPGLGESTGGIYDLSGGAVFPAPIVSLTRAGFSGLYPDGSIYLTTSRPAAGPGSTGGSGNVKGTFGPAASKLVDAATGMDIAGNGVPTDALMPMFSIDGKMVVFNQGGHNLVTMAFDRASHAFSGAKTAFTDATNFIGWPAFLPDVARTDAELQQPTGRRVVFAIGITDDYVTQDVGFVDPGQRPHRSDLWWVDLDSGMAAPLSRAGGFEGTASYLPYAARDEHRDFMPTVSPVAAGGYFWVFFSSRRQYGNELVYGDTDTIPEPEGKKIWVAAIDANAAPGSDPSHPAFFLPGQEHESGNVRAFAALSPCRVDGESCETGIDCCSGHCVNGLCGEPVNECSELDEKCVTTADCCEGKALLCIGGFCGYDTPQ
jgi:hypothetical protein